MRLTAFLEEPISNGHSPHSGDAVAAQSRAVLHQSQHIVSYHRPFVAFMTFHRLLSLFTTATAMRSALSQTSVGFDAAAASNSHLGDFAADNAMSPGSGYWCR